MEQSKESRPIAILGAGGHAKVVLSTLRAAGHTVDAFYDDNRLFRGAALDGVPVRGTLEHALAREDHLLIAGVGGNRARREIVGRFPLRDWCVACHPTAWIAPTAVVGRGAAVFAGAVVQPDALVGEHAILNTGCTVDHDCEIGSFAHVGPGVHLCGAASVGRGALLGVGAVVTPGIQIGDWAVVGAGAVVVRNVPEGTTVVGVPAKPLSR